MVGDIEGREWSGGTSRSVGTDSMCSVQFSKSEKQNRQIGREDLCRLKLELKQNK